MSYARNVKLLPTATSEKRRPFEPKELTLPWQHTDDFAARFALMLCYSRCRPSGLLRIKREDLRLTERYMDSGMITAASKHHTISIAQRIVPLVGTELTTVAQLSSVSPQDGHQSALAYPSMRYYWDHAPHLYAQDHRLGHRGHRQNLILPPPQCSLYVTFPRKISLHNKVKIPASSRLIGIL